MRYVTFLFCLLCLFIVVPGASAQDAGVDSGDIETLDPTMSCLQRCSQTHEMCVSTATFMDCIATEPACRDVRPHDAEILAAFCTACGGATVGCEADEPAVVAGSASGGPSPDPPRSGAVAPSSERPRAPTAAERERTALERARGICSRQRGIWDAETTVLMPDGTLRLGVCRTPEGYELVQMIRDEHGIRAEADDRLGRRITAEERARTAADTIHSRDISLIEAGDVERDARIAALIGMVACLQARAERIPLARFDTTLREEMRSSGLARIEDGYFICHGLRDVDGVPFSDSSSAPRPSTRPRRPDEHPTLGGQGSGLHIRLQLFGHVGFTSIHPTLAQMRGGLQTLPAGLGFDATVFAPIANGWYVEGGAGLTYDWPDFQPFATNARVWYHAGLAVYPVPIFSIGFGYLGSDRFRPNLTSAYSFHGAYLDLSLHFHMRLEDRVIHGSSDVTDPAFVITLRGAAGAAIRPAAALAPDGLLQLMAGLEF